MIPNLSGSFYVGNNKLKELDISHLPSMGMFNCSDNIITKLILPKVNGFIYCENNQIKELDFSGKSVLRLYCYGNLIDELDLSDPDVLPDLRRSDIKKENRNDSTVRYYYEEGNSECNVLWCDASTKLILEKSVTEVFEDVKTGAWYVNAIQYAYNNGYMTGKGSSFKPNDNLTREEFTQVLYGIEGKPAVTIANPFSDVKDTWYKNSVLWAKENSIADGKPDGTFGISKPISRQDLAVMLYKYADMKGFDVTKNDSAIIGYKDTNSVQRYAKDAMNWAVSHGIISGKGRIRHFFDN